MLPGATDEDWTFAVDKRMEALEGVVYRRALSEARDTANTQAVTAMQADLAQIKTEHAQARASRKAKLQDKIDQLNTKIQQHLSKAKERHEAAKAEAQTKINVLQAKAARAREKMNAFNSGDAIVKRPGLSAISGERSTEVTRIPGKHQAPCDRQFRSMYREPPVPDRGPGLDSRYSEARPEPSRRRG